MAAAAKEQSTPGRDFTAPLWAWALLLAVAVLDGLDSFERVAADGPGLLALAHLVMSALSVVFVLARSLRLALLAAALSILLVWMEAIVQSGGSMDFATENPFVAANLVFMLIGLPVIAVAVLYFAWRQERPRLAVLLSILPALARFAAIVAFMSGAIYAI